MILRHGWYGAVTFQDWSAFYAQVLVTSLLDRGGIAGVRYRIVGGTKLLVGSWPSYLVYVRSLDEIAEMRLGAKGLVKPPGSLHEVRSIEICLVWLG